MPIGPKGPPQKPGLSIRGRVIFDTWRGIPRVRPWPVKRPTTPGTKRHLTAKAFGAANRACKVTAAKIYGAHWEATRGTPLLPRDLMIAFMYGRAIAIELPDGRIIRSMASRNDVSKSLDMISNEPGKYLVRGPQYWEPQTPPTVQGLQLFYDEPVPGGTPNIDIPLGNLGQSFKILADGITTSFNTQRAIRVSTDGGMTYWDTADSYRWFSSSGAVSAASYMVLHDVSTSAGRTGQWQGEGFGLTASPKTFHVPNSANGSWYFTKSLDPITHVRLTTSTGALIQSGHIYCWGE